MKVKVIKSSEDNYWYAKYIGEIIEVVECYDYDCDDHKVVDYQRYDDDPDTINLYIMRQDCEILSKTCEEVTMAQAKEETKEFKVGDEVTIIKATGMNAESKKKHIGQSFVIANIDHRGYIGSNCTAGIYLYYPEELELVESKEPVLTKEEALKAAIDGADVTNELCINEYARISWNGKVFMLIYNRSGYKDQADGVLNAKQWKLWTPPTPKPKFSIDQFVVCEESYYRILDSEYKHGSYRYFLSSGTFVKTKDDCLYIDESQLSEVKQ